MNYQYTIQIILYAFSTNAHRNKHILPWHESESCIQGYGVGWHQDGIKVAGDEVTRNVFQVIKHGF